MAERRPDRTLGPGHDLFWDYCARGELRLPRCTACRHLCWPIADVCERCGGGAFAWDRMSGRGTLVSWATFERDYYRGTLPVPYDTILVELAEGPLFLSNPKGFAWRDCALDLPVTLAFLACEDDAGPFALPVFEKA